MFVVGDHTVTESDHLSPANFEKCGSHKVSKRANGMDDAVAAIVLHLNYYDRRISFEKVVLGEDPQTQLECLISNR